MNNPFALDQKNVLITGAAQGIGFVLAQGLARQGACVFINDRTAEQTDSTVEQLKAQGFQAWAVPFDVTDSAQAQASIDRAECEIGPIDILINNAGLQRRHPFTEFPEAEWDAIIAVNQKAVFIISQIVARHMVVRNRGKIINIGSMQSEFGRDTITPYAASKGAVKMLTRGMCVELARYNIQVNGIAPGYFETAMTRPLVDDEAFTGWIKTRVPASRWGQPEELIGTAIFLASEASNFVNGQLLFVDGGMSVAV